ncbi:Transmembrane_domain-containing protein [Hexamita inflata]|uniref:Transmembrane domain-containing protein n=1 Tax=Hexamita inflata TaxID=28002 RepID=A0AA86PLG5_9EUKA|nr:Transmembrane domain-containing protein [Hexamita inflata]
MENAGKDHDSDMSFGSSSNSSKSSKQTKVDEETLKMGTEPIKKLIPKGYMIHLVSIIFPQIAKTIEMSLVVRFVGIEAVPDLILLQPIYEMIAFHVTAAVAQSTNIFVSRNISKNQLVAANIYLAHYFLIAIIWVIIALVLYFAVLKSIFTNEIVGQYLMLRAGIGSFTCMFSRSLTSYLKSENRYFVILVRDIAEQLMFIAILVTTYVNSQYIGVSLTNAGISYIVANGVIAVWMFILIMKIPFLDVEYRGVCRFQFRRLSPVRPKIIVQILGYTVPQLLTNATDTLLQLEAVLFVKYLVKQSDYITIQNVRLLVFTRVKALMQSFILAFRDIFQQLASYNMGIKKITRVYETLHWTLVYQFVLCIPLLIIALFVSKYLVNAILPVANPQDPFFLNVVSESQSAALAGAWCMFLPLPYYIVIQLLQLESKLLLSALLQLPMLAFGGGYMYYVLVELADNAPLYLVIALSEVINAIIGWGFLIFFYVKYYKLNKLNANHKDIVVDEATVAANDEVRQSVMVQLTSNVEVEDPKKIRQSVTNLFNKGAVLKTSRDFLSLRESVSTNLRASEMRASEMRSSEMRGSEYRGSEMGKK